jgi:hypothetical protein
MAKGESILLKGRLPPSYDNTLNLTVEVRGISATAVAGDVVIGLEFDSLNTQDFDANTFAAAVAVTATAGGTSGVMFTHTFSLTAAQLDSTPAFGLFRLQLTRQNVAGDNMTGDWQGVDVVMYQ